MKEVKNYKQQIPDNEMVAAEPVIVYAVETEDSTCKVFTSRDDSNRSITGDELLNRLRPRIKSLFV